MLMPIAMPIPRFPNGTWETVWFYNKLINVSTRNKDVNTKYFGANLRVNNLRILRITNAKFLVNYFYMNRNMRNS